MASGYITSARTEGREILPWSISDPGYFSDSGQDFGIDKMYQLTTSYRTGLQAGSKVNVDASEETPTTEAGVFQYLRKDEMYGNDNPQGLSDTGHEFTTEKTFLGSLSHRSVSISRGTIQYTGPLIPADSGAVPPTGDKAANFDNQSYYGPKAIAGTIPTDPATHVAEVLGEILERSFLPSLTGVKFKTFQEMLNRISEGYLNFQFGWKPFKKDIQDLLAGVTSANEVIRQYERDSGKPVRRKYNFPVENATTVTTSTNSTVMPQDGHGGYPNSSSYSQYLGIGSRGGTHTKTVSTEKKIWFSGAYTYLASLNYNSGSAISERAASINHLLGLELTPKDVWDLAPWSWLVDWRYNVGDNIKNASLLASDGLVIKYGYLMCTTSTVTTHTLEGWTDWSGSSYGPISATFYSIKKERHRASPYGFGTNPASLSDKQWAILAALGFTRGWKVFL